MYKLTFFQGVHPLESKTYKDFGRATIAFFNDLRDDSDTKRLYKKMEGEWQLIEEKHIPLFTQAEQLFDKAEKKLLGFYNTIV